MTMTVMRITVMTMTIKKEIVTINSNDYKNDDSNNNKSTTDKQQ